MLSYHPLSRSQKAHQCCILQTLRWTVAARLHRWLHSTQVLQLHFSPQGTRACQGRTSLAREEAWLKTWEFRLMGHMGTRRSIRVPPRATGLWLPVGLGQIDFSSIKKLILAFRNVFFPLDSCSSLGKYILKVWIFDTIFSPALQKQKELKKFWYFYLILHKTQIFFFLFLTDFISGRI